MKKMEHRIWIFRVIMIILITIIVIAKINIYHLRKSMNSIDLKRNSLSTNSKRYNNINENLIGSNEKDSTLIQYHDNNRISDTALNNILNYYAENIVNREDYEELNVNGRECRAYKCIENESMEVMNYVVIDMNTGEVITTEIGKDIDSVYEIDDSKWTICN